MKQSILLLVLILLSATVASGQAAPSVIATMPADAANDVSINTTIKATFSHDMDASTITGGTFKIGGAIGDVLYDGPSKTATFIPFTYLTNATSYTATITTGVKDVSGNSMASNYFWTFTTTASSTVIAMDPSPNAKDVSTNPVITATFDRDMDPASVGESSFGVRTTITFAGFSCPYYYFPGAGKVTYDAATRTATLTLPGEKLLPGTVNTVIINYVKDVSGNTIPPYAWSFTTGGSPPPTVTAVDPSGGAKDVALSTKVQITFNKDMDPATINGDTLSLRLPPPPNATCIGICLGKKVAGTVAYEAVTKMAVFTPSADLKTGTKYTAVLIAGTKGVHDTSGNKIPVNAVEGFEGFAWTYTTTGPPPPLPTVTATDPPDKAQGVPLDSTVKVTFDKDMDKATIECILGPVFPKSPPYIIGGKITYDVPTKTATIVPLSNLQAGTTYMVGIMASDTSDNYMSYDWSFTTVGTPSGGGGGGGGGGSSCFIATAAYGSYFHPFVKVLRSFRDTFLLTTAVGRSFVAWYYKVSPSVADAVRTSKTARAGVRIALLPAVGISYLSLTIGVAPTLLILLLFLAVIGLGIRKLYLHRRNCLG